MIESCHLSIEPKVVANAILVAAAIHIKSSYRQARNLPLEVQCPFQRPAQHVAVASPWRPWAGWLWRRLPVHLPGCSGIRSSRREVF